MFSIRPSQTKFVFQDRILELRIGNRYFLKVEDDEETFRMFVYFHKCLFCFCQCLDKKIEIHVLTPFLAV